MIVIRTMEDRTLGCHDGHSWDGGSNASVSWWSLVHWAIKHLGDVMVVRVAEMRALRCHDRHHRENKLSHIPMGTLTRAGEIACVTGYIIHYAE